MARKRNKKISLLEFRAWLEGVEELQPSDWSPSAEQWKLIREKIKLIKEPEPEVVKESTPTPPQQPVPAGNAPMMPQFSGEPALPPPVPSSIPLDAEIEMSPEAKRLLQGNPSAPAQPGQTGPVDDAYTTSPFQ